MKKFKAFLIMLSLVGLHSCNDPEDVSLDMSDCQESFDWTLVTDKPMWSVMIPVKSPYITIEDYFVDTTADGVTSFGWAFKCSADSTVCYFDGRSNGGLYVFGYHNDTVGWSRDCMECDDHGYKLQCKLTSEFSETVNTKSGKHNQTYFHWLDRDDVLVLDTMTSITERSLYRKWWPLPREPWPIGQSRIADCMIYRDQISDSTESEIGDYWNDSLPTTKDMCK